MTRITVFGGSRPRPEEPAYKEAYHLGHLLGKAGYTVLTGGYIGTMEAVSRGANEAGTHVIGVTCDDIENFRAIKHNDWVLEELRFPSLRLRLFGLIDNCEAALALPGGAGTLAEISMMWNHLITHSITSRPLILIGNGWRRAFEAIFESQEKYIVESDQQWLAFSPTVEEAFVRLQEYLALSKK